MKKVLVLLSALFLFSCTNNKSDNFSLGKQSMNRKNYHLASNYFKIVSLKNKNRDSAVILKKYCDSMYQAKVEREKFISDSLQKIKLKQEIQNNIT